MNIRWIIIAAVIPAGLMCAVPAHAGPNGPDYPCQYPGVGVAANAVGGYGGFCDFPTEINGSHWHCETGGFDIGGFGFSGSSGINLGGLSALGGGGTSCTWRCPDNTLAAAAPNPPGAWKDHIEPTNIACQGHTEPAGFYSETVRPDQGALGEEGGHTPAVTNPDNPNPEATENSPRR